MGLPHLIGTNLAKVQAANKLYSFGVQPLFLCFQLNILVSIENPSRSWLWGILTSLVAAMTAMNDAAFTQWFAALVATDFHACMHEGERNKRTVRASWPLLDYMMSLLQSATTAILTNRGSLCSEVLVWNLQQPWKQNIPKS